MLPKKDGWEGDMYTERGGAEKYVNKINTMIGKIIVITEQRIWNDNFHTTVKVLVK